jgi:lipopolysaccharide export system permease protein
MVSMAKDLEDLSLFQIKQILDTMPPDENPHVTPHLVKYQKILAAPLTPLIIIVIAIPFAIGGVRTNPVIGISKALGLFVFYILISKGFTLFGETKLLSPFFAAWTPNFLVLSVASFFGFRE